VGCVRTERNGGGEWGWYEWKEDREIERGQGFLEAEEGIANRCANGGGHI